VTVCTQTTKVANNDYITDLLATAVFTIIVTTVIQVKTGPVARQRRATAEAGTSGEGYKRQDQKGPVRELAGEVIVGRRLRLIGRL
jgi:hypothetical protein